jgi:hypothetical protein
VTAFTHVTAAAYATLDSLHNNLPRSVEQYPRRGRITIAAPD